MPMYNLLEYSWSYSDTIGSLWFYSKDKATNFNAAFRNNDNFKSFKYKTKLLGRRVVNGLNRILRDTTIAVPLIDLSNF